MIIKFIIYKLYYEKKLFYAGAFICAMAALSSCTNDELSYRFEKDGMIEVTAGMDAGSRTAVEDELNGKGEYDIVWSAGDEIYLFGGKSYATMTLISGAGNSEAQFDGRIYGYTSQLKNAIYPVPTVNGDGTYGLVLGNEYGYSEQSNAPMFSSLSDNFVSFGLLTAMARINVDVEEGDVVELIMKNKCLGIRRLLCQRMGGYHQECNFRRCQCGRKQTRCTCHQCRNQA